MKYYKALLDNIQSVWLLIEHNDKTCDVYTRPPCMYEGKLTKRAEKYRLLTTVEDYKKYHAVFEISKEEAFIELL